ncbi:HSP20 family small heat-shock protein [Akkermansiaceae bacterium]|nr:HSP20 family small heat-shock protein [Akkermansiaceae bacterium]
MSETTYPIERPRFRTKVIECGLELAIVLPGVSKEALTVNVEDRLLSISGERRFESGAEERDYQLQLRLHDDLDPSKIEASHQNGVLRLKLSKRPELTPRRIDILAN